jgi:hypothetical protein
MRGCVTFVLTSLSIVMSALAAKLAQAAQACQRGHPVLKHLGNLLPIIGKHWLICE